MHICENSSLSHVVMKLCPSLIAGRKSKRERERERKREKERETGARISFRENQTASADRQVERDV